VNGQCCNLGKGCQGKKKVYEPPLDLSAVSVDQLGSDSPSSARNVLLLAALCGSIAVCLVAVGAYILYKRAKDFTILYSKLP